MQNDWQSAKFRNQFCEVRWSGMNIFSWAIALWPIVTVLLAVNIHRRQNSKKAWTGGPISWPKALWLAFTVQHWFVVPIFFLLHPEFPEDLFAVYIFHLISWWIRGPLELVMIYKWLNWTPFYGIGHDIFHILGVTTLLLLACFSVGTPADGISFLSVSYIFLILFTTSVEAYFAYLFLTTRSHAEADENIYFASDDPKWIFINRVTTFFVSISFTYLSFQSICIFYLALRGSP